MVLASRGQRETESGAREDLGDDGLAALLRRKASRVWLLVAVATGATGALLLLARHPLV